MSGKERGAGAFLRNSAPVLKLVLFAALCLTATRVALITLFRLKLHAATGMTDILTAMWRGFYFDIQVGFYLAIPALLALLASVFGSSKKYVNKTALAAGYVFAAVMPLIAVISHGYIREYGDLFNHFLFGIIYDDREAIFKTIWNEHPVIWASLIWLVLVVILWKLLKRFIEGDFLKGSFKRAAGRGPAVRALWVVLVIGLLAVSARGGPGYYPIQMRDRDVTGDEFLNKLVLNPISALRYAIKHHREANATALDPSALDPAKVKAALERLFPDAGETAGIDERAKRTVTTGGMKARHVFLIVMESYDSWPFTEPYSRLDLVPGGTSLGREGVFVRSFLSATGGTMGSLAVLTTGLFAPALRPNYLPSSQKPYGTAIAKNFADHGFRTRLYYGGTLSWQRYGDFAENQGFMERHSMNSIKNARTLNEWGVDDGSLFDFVEKDYKGDEPGFTMIMTTGNHPTYSHDIESAGWKPRILPPEVAGMADGTLPDRVMGHLWYSDKVMSSFVRKMWERYPDAVFAVTGDHFSRRFINQRPSLYESTSVPLIIYGPKVLEGKTVSERLAGCHLDIAPTLYELSFPEGSAYESLGRNLLMPGAEPDGFGNASVITPDAIAPNAFGAAPVLLPWGKAMPEKGETERAASRAEDVRTVSTWRMARGNSLE